MDDNDLFYYRDETQEKIKTLINRRPELESEVLEIAELAHADGADNATNGYGYPVRKYIGPWPDQPGSNNDRIGPKRPRRKDVY
jgi:hypothetical protein